MTSPSADWPFPAVTEETVARYRDNYSLDDDTPVTTTMVKRHITLEHELKNLLLGATPESRPRVWAESYDQLYRDLPWLASTSSVDDKSLKIQFGHFLKLIAKSSHVIEIGSGHGALAKYLNDADRPCIATEISAERGARQRDGVIWHATDGVHLEDFEPQLHYDVVLSTQVVEHFHPDDLARHFEGAAAVLKPNGRYILTTPHIFFGPADLSRVLQLPTAQFMHLKEYTHHELGDIALQSGFATVAAVYIPPAKVRRLFPFMLNSRRLYKYLSFLEYRLVGRRVAPMLLRALLFHGDVFLVATK